MSKGFIVGGGGAAAFAFVLVTYPEGSTVTCTNASGKKDISTTQRLFYIKKGTVPFNCVVTATNGTQTTSKTVSIEYEGQSVNLSLAYELVLFDGDNGGDNTEVTGGWEAINQATLTVTETEIVLASNVTTTRRAFAKNPIPVYNYSRISFTGYTNNSSSRFLIATGKLNTPEVVVATVTAPLNVAEEVYIDLSALSLTDGVDYYVGLSNGSLSSKTTLLKCILT